MQVIEQIVHWVKGRMEHARKQDSFQRDPEFLERWQPVLGGVVRRWFRPVFEGEVYLPDEGPMLLVANHSGGLYTPEAYVLIDWWMRTRGADRPMYILAHDFLFAIPGFGGVLRRAGGITASWDNAERALAEGAAVLVFPGGDHEAFRPWWERGLIDFNNRKGFVRLALRSGAPIVPVVSHGSHDTTFVLSRGERLAELMQLPRKLRSTAFPLVIGAPWGLVPGFIPIIPLPARITVSILRPLCWPDLSPHGAEDSELVGRCFRQVTARMQATLTQLVRDQPYPLFR